jgi:predicted MPP superfamily phosphohydrolase
MCQNLLMALMNQIIKFLLVILQWIYTKYPDIPKIDYLSIPGRHNLKIVQLSDLHFESEAIYHKLQPNVLRDVIIKVNALEPDLIFLTGDFIDKNQESIHELCKYLVKLKAKLGIFVVTGNHDGKNPTYVLNALKNINFHVLANDTYRIGEIEIVGVHDFYSSEFGRFKLLKLNESCTTRFILSHNPDSYKEFVKFGWKFDMQFSGHSHSGQICLPNGEPVLKYVRKLMKFLPWVPRQIYVWATIIDWDLKASNLHVNRGLGGHPPGRLFCPPEITCLQMEKITE